jgi:hypothetical protein
MALRAEYGLFQRKLAVIRTNYRKNLTEKAELELKMDDQDSKLLKLGDTARTKIHILQQALEELLFERMGSAQLRPAAQSAAEGSGEKAADANAAPFSGGTNGPPSARKGHAGVEAAAAAARKEKVAELEVRSTSSKEDTASKTGASAAVALYKKINGMRTSFVSVSDIEDVAATVLTLADTIGELERKIEEDKSQVAQLEAQVEGKDIMCQQYEEQVVLVVCVCVCVCVRVCVWATSTC